MLPGVFTPSSAPAFTGQREHALWWLQAWMQIRALPLPRLTLGTLPPP